MNAHAHQQAHKTLNVSLSRTRALTAVCVAALGLMAASAASAADTGLQWLPIANNPAWKPEPTLALTGNRVNPGTGSNASGWGAELNFNCGLVQTADNRIRSHLNVSHTSENGTTVNAYELSPRYTLPMGDGLSVGAGPSVGVFRVSPSGATARTLYGMGVAAGVNYRVGMFYTGLDLRYHATGSRSGVDLDPTTLSAKVGINF